MSEHCSLGEALQKCLPDVIWRSEWDNLRESCGLPYSKRTMANKDSRKEGPKSHKWNGKVYYHREDVLVWLDDHTVHSSPPPHGGNATQAATLS